MFTKAIVRTPCRNMIKGLTGANLGIPDYEKALEQHAAYITELENCGLQVQVLPPDEDFPDSTFVEDTALITPDCAVLTRPGAPTRRREIDSMREVLQSEFSQLEVIEAPGTLEAGDIMKAGTHFFIGISARTNKFGAVQMIEILEKVGYTASTVPLQHVLHLKTGVAYLENHRLAACGEFVTSEYFKDFTILEIPEDEAYAANCIWVNDRVIIPTGYPRSRRIMESAGDHVDEVDVSEFRKLDGGLSCLSLRF